MLFSSMTFLWIFFPIVVVGAFILKGEIQYQNIFLLLASLIFYAWGEPIYILLMLVSILLNWLSGILINQLPRYKKGLLVGCIIINLSLLSCFKYYNFFISTLNAILGVEIFDARDIALPIGISFFTFQALSYVIDLYRGNCKVQKNVLNLALYVSFFPQLIAGPIVRYKDVDKQIQCRKMTMEKFAIGLRRFTYGLGKKVIISNCCAEIADQLFSLNIESLTTVGAWSAAILYTLQIYYDFSGYSDMAIGLGKIFGFDFLENFNYPYISKSIHEFWQRWHISLGSWFKEYVYIPLGGNRKGKFRTYVNLCTVFFLTGMWHGASWNFIVWGLYHGFFQIVERWGFEKILKKSKTFSSLYCLTVVITGWVLFRVESLTGGLRIIARMFLPWRYEFFRTGELATLFSVRKVLIICLGIIGSGVIQSIGRKFPNLSEKWKYSFFECVFCAMILLYSIMLLVSGTYNPFIYFRF